ncbi:hypothetical protein AUJ68_05815 [Candidatus Woesearchaeota archaeon CG1_02_57_44]|nr:MAG: hypothetical protein AUJ68_05815 [Candidatus Woesearchaeota archaeon CG1_02_57_44]PIN68511.1 MAG: aspartate ammonia-lyase [Candidatus Woesearchaeota archaeon CG11_big_fil_rev_8_21_14_0_20_57_5]
MRTEKDSLGSLQVPDDALYGIHTMRSLNNFDGLGRPFDLPIVHAMALLKQACALANHDLGLLDATTTRAIIQACESIRDGQHDAWFPIDVFQAGSGTSSNMNVNEVIANIASAGMGAEKGSRAVHPNDDVNKGQSTNNIVPSAIRIACVVLTDTLLTRVQGLAAALEGKAAAYSSVNKSARTHLQDAVPITLGQEFGAYARALEKDIARLRVARQGLLELGVGGNAAGTGVNTKPGFRQAIIAHLRSLTDEDYTQAVDGIEATQFLTDLGALSGAMRMLCVDVQKIVNDLRLLSSGPNTGMADIALPPVEPGSSIMPGKINPSICEAANQACLYCLGLDHSVALACAAGQLELNTHMPLVGHCLVSMLQVMARTCSSLDARCVRGVAANVQTCQGHFERSAGLATILNPRLGYDKVAELVKESLASGRTVKEIALAKRILTEQEYAALIAGSTQPNL